MPLSLLFILFALAPLPLHTERAPEMQPLPPLPPNTAVSVPAAPEIDIAKAAAEVERQLHPEALLPSQLIIPSIKLKSSIEHVGVNESGEMAVPDGSTNTVGWYRYGAVPGENGSAVMDAHVYAAFKKLKNVKVGSDVYVVNAKGETKHFRVIASKVYPLAQVPMNTIFNDTSGSFLNFITCEGRYIRSLSTYEKRRVVYAQLVD